MNALLGVRTGCVCVGPTLVAAMQPYCKPAAPWGGDLGHLHAGTSPVRPRKGQSLFCDSKVEKVSLTLSLSLSLSLGLCDSYNMR